MLLDISRLRTAAQDVNRQIGPEAFADLKEDFRVVGTTEVVGTVRREKGTTVILEARVSSVMEVTCGRCLEPFTMPMYVDVTTRFVPPADFAKVTAETAARAGRLKDGAPGAADEDPADDEEGEAVEPEGKDVGLAEYRDEQIDLGEVVREQLYLTLPMKPLCREDCKGLCPVCGVNRNRETCTCQQEWVDPRMAALKEWKTRNE
ncbi:MAG TPA: DUF177 domain-containing protein, partial [Vicinamibacterales bacterium]|nr:DUF177 domain-containing protein [Vicinamibacterales bacterium]